MPIPVTLDVRMGFIFRMLGGAIVTRYKKSLKKHWHISRLIALLAQLIVASQLKTCISDYH